MPGQEIFVLLSQSIEQHPMVKANNKPAGTLDLPKFWGHQFFVVSRRGKPSTLGKRFLRTKADAKPENQLWYGAIKWVKPQEAEDWPNKPGFFKFTALTGPVPEKKP